MHFLINFSSWPFHASPALWSSSATLPKMVVQRVKIQDLLGFGVGYFPYDCYTLGSQHVLQDLLQITQRAKNMTELPVLCTANRLGKQTGSTWINGRIIL